MAKIIGRTVGPDKTPRVHKIAVYKIFEEGCVKEKHPIKLAPRKVKVTIEKGVLSKSEEELKRLELERPVSKSLFE